MRWLCLHGQGSSAEIFERQLGKYQIHYSELHDDAHIFTAPLRSLLPHTWQFDFVDSSHDCSAAEELELVYPGPYHCFFPRYTSEAMEEAVQYVQEVVDEDGPYDCVIGFSQVRQLWNSCRLNSGPQKNLIIGINV